MAGNRAFENANGQCRPRPFAKAQTQVQKWLLTQRIKQSLMCAFGAEMPRHRMIERAGLRLFQHGCGGAADKTIKDNRDTVMPRSRNRAGHRGQFAPAQTPQRL